MWYKVLLLLAATHRCFADYEIGGACINKLGNVGKCKELDSCASVQKLLDDDKSNEVEHCGSSKTGLVVCCFDDVPSDMSTKAPPELGPDGCVPIPADKTSKRNGQKAWDKCIEYQEKLIFPCKTSGLSPVKDRSQVCNHDTKELIVGGIHAMRHEFPHMVLLGLHNKTEKHTYWECGGSLISERFVITAGHCISHKEKGKLTYALVGAFERGEVHDESKIYKIENIIRHPQYKPPIKYHDITLLKLHKDVVLSEFVVPACLHVGNNVDDDRVVATGWGHTTQGGKTSQKLQRVVLEKLNEQCQESYQQTRLLPRGFSDDSQLCYGNLKEARDTCQGDSGGPLQIKSAEIFCMYTLVGITSAGKGCGDTKEFPLYTKISYYVDWIESVVWP